MHGVARAFAVVVVLSTSLVACRELLPSKKSQAGWDKPWFCHDLDCPRFTIKNTTTAYQTREYQSGKYATLAKPKLMQERCF